MELAGKVWQTMEAFFSFFSGFYTLLLGYERCLVSGLCCSLYIPYFRLKWKDMSHVILLGVCVLMDCT